MHQQELPVQIDEYIQSHYTERIDAVSIAQHFHIGKTKIYEIARQNYGMGIAEYIRKLRIDRARQLLAEQTDLSLAEIAISVVSVIIIILSRYLRSWSEFHRSRTGNRS